MSYEESKEYVSVYVSTDLTDRKRIESIRDGMMWNLEAETFFKRVTPHITVLPPFMIPESNLDKFKEAVQQVRLPDNTVTVNGAAVWRNVRRPYVVMLDVDVKMGGLIRELRNEADELGGYNFKEPVSPHITLLKSKGWWESIPDTVAWRLQKEIKRNRVVQNTQIEKLKVIVN